VRESLVSSVLGASYATPRKTKPVKIQGRPAGKEPDHVILEIRRLYEQHGMSPMQIRQHLAGFGIDVSAERIGHIGRYATRSHLVPAEGAEPYLTKENAPCTT
jgi:hypothetical protein